MKALIDWLGEPWEDDILNLERDVCRSTRQRTARDERRIWLGDRAESSSDVDNAAKDREALERDKGRYAEEVFKSSVGNTRKTKNLPYLAQLYVTSAPLMRELGYL